MEINKIIINGVEYSITDKKANMILNIVNGRLDQLESDFAKALKDIDERFVEERTYLTLIDV